MVCAVFLRVTLVVGLLSAVALQAQQPLPPAQTGGAHGYRKNPLRAGNSGQSGPVAPTAAAQPTSRVTFRDGLLSVHAHNTNLADVLNAIQRKTGASFEFPSSAAQELVAVDLGPASPHDVLASLLNGSRFDYIVLGRPDDPNDIAQVMLQEKSGANGSAIASSATAPQPAVGSYQPPAEVPQGGDEDVPTEIPDDETQQPPPPSAAPEQQNPKTPEQMLEELKRMQQQQQQQQQGGQPIQQPNQPGVQQVPPGQPQMQGPYPQQPYPQPQPQQSPQDDSEPQPH